MHVKRSRTTRESAKTTDDVLAAERIDLQEASLLPAVVGKSMRKEIFERLQQAVTKYSSDPRSVMLGGSLSRLLEESESPTSGLPAEMLQPAAQSLYALSNAEPTNLFIALRASTLNIEAKSSAAKELNSTHVRPFCCD